AAPCTSPMTRGWTEWSSRPPRPPSRSCATWPAPPPSDPERPETVAGLQRNRQHEVALEVAAEREHRLAHLGEAPARVEGPSAVVPLPDAQPEHVMPSGAGLVQAALHERRAHAGSLEGPVHVQPRDMEGPASRDTGLGLHLLEQGEARGSPSGLGDQIGAM